MIKYIIKRNGAEKFKSIFENMHRLFVYDMLGIERDLFKFVNKLSLSLPVKQLFRPINTLSPERLVSLICEDLKRN